LRWLIHNKCSLYFSFIPGWDCHGLPIEHKALEEQKKQQAAARKQGTD
jgi:isoleucyl-tRNA synthetase